MLKKIDKNVYASKCPKCGHLHYPAPMRCHECKERRDPSKTVFADFEKVPLRGTCKLLTFTRVYALPDGYDLKYMNFGLVEFENGIRAAGQIMTDDLKLGMPLIAKTGVVKEVIGKDIYGLQFYPCE
ncbi:DNA-binding protein [bacterium]|nr:DNA-binding protein [bacterium]